MSENIGIEARFFWNYVACGMMLTFVYDCIRIVRRVIPHSDLVVGVEDGLFWLAALYEFYSMLYRLNDGVPRYFAMAGACLGIKIYKKIVKEYFVDYISKLCKRILDVVLYAIKWLFSPLFWIKNKLTGLNKLVMITLCKRVKIRFLEKHARGKPDEP